MPRELNAVTVTTTEDVARLQGEAKALCEMAEARGMKLWADIAQAMLAGYAVAIDNLLNIEVPDDENAQVMLAEHAGQVLGDMGVVLGSLREGLGLSDSSSPEAPLQHA